MNLMGNFDNLLNQGPVFWAAAAAVAGGLTLLLVSLTLQVRKLFSGGWSLNKIKPLKLIPFLNRNNKYHPAINVTDTGYSLAGKAPRTSRSFSKTDSENNLINDPNVLESLSLRLRQAGDQLEELDNSVSTLQATTRNSLLKHHNENVEYLVRTGIS